MTLETVFYALWWVIVFLISVTIHEAAHAWAAKRGGDPTAYINGQVSLNPWPHIKHQPLGMLVFPIVSAILLGWPFGYASAPFNRQWAYDHPRKAAWMAAAGPAANLLLVILSCIIIKIGILTGVFFEPYSVNLQQIVDASDSKIWYGLSIFVSMLFSMNVILLVLNIIPLPPLDGSSIITLFLKENTARTFNTVVSNPMFGFVGLFLAWTLFSPLIDVIFPGIINILYWGSHFD